MVDPGGKPVGGLRVAVMISPVRQIVDRGTERAPLVLGEAETDERGRFRVAIPRVSPAHHFDPVVIATAPGYGPGGQSFNADAESPTLTITLDAERVVRGRLADPLGLPAAGVEVEVQGFSNRSPGVVDGFSVRESPDRPSCWPRPVTTDGQGRFTISGLGRTIRARLAIRDERFAPEVIEVGPADEDPSREMTVTLTRARPIVVRVIRTDDRRPVADARVVVIATRGGLSGQMRSQTHGRTDEKGRFRVIPSTGDFLHVNVIPPDGEPYLMYRLDTPWPEAPDSQEFELALPRGILTRGTITESPSGRPVAGARVFFVQRFADNPLYLGDYQRTRHDFQQDAVSGPDGRFTLAVPPGPGHLLVQGPTADYIHEEINQGELNTIRHEWRLYPDGLMPLDLKTGTGPHDVAIRLRRGVTLAGRVVGPDGEAVAEAVLFCRSYVPFSHLSVDSNFAGATLKVRDGRFELPGCDPEKPSTLYFFDAKNQLGAVAELSSQTVGGGTVTIKLEPCGTASARFVDAQGKPIAGLQPTPELVVTPGTHDGSDTTRSTPFPDVVFASDLDRPRYSNLRTDERGRCTIPSLIPGAHYWLMGREFTVRAGGRLELGDLLTR